MPIGSVVEEHYAEVAVPDEPATHVKSTVFEHVADDPATDGEIDGLVATVVNVTDDPALSISDGCHSADDGDSVL